MLQIEAGVVLHHLVQARHHGAVGQHRLQPEHHVARHAVADDAVAARVCGQVAADGARAACAEVERAEVACRVGCLLHGFERCAGAHRHRGRGAVDLLDADQPLERQRDLVRLGACTTAQAGQTALRHHGDVVLVADAEGRRYA